MQNLQNEEKKLFKNLMQIPTGTTVAEITKAQWPFCFMDWHNKHQEWKSTTPPQHWGNTGALVLSFRCEKWGFHVAPSVI